MKLINPVRRLWIKCLTDKRYARVTEAVVWSFMGIMLGVFFLGVESNWQPDYPSVVPQPTPTEIP